jgi:uncharacterized protein YqfA (UPF0365 family)
VIVFFIRPIGLWIRDGASATVIGSLIGMRFAGSSARVVMP